MMLFEKGMYLYSGVVWLQSPFLVLCRFLRDKRDTPNAVMFSNLYRVWSMTISAPEL